MTSARGKGSAVTTGSAERLREPFTTPGLSRTAVALGVAATAAYVVAPAGSVVQTVLWSVPFLMSVVLVAARVALCPTDVRRPLQVLLAGAATYVVASFPWYVLPVHGGVVLPFPSVLDATYFAAYALYATFLWLVLRRTAEHTALQARLVLTDATIVTLAVSSVLWVTVIEPQLSPGTSGLPTLVALGYPAAQVVLVALVARLVMSDRLVQGPAALLLFAWIGSELLADMFYGIQSVAGTFSYTGPLVPLWMLAYTALAAFAVHPGLGALLQGGPAEATAPAPRRFASSGSARVARLGRFVLLLVAALVPMVLAVVRDGLDLALLAAATVTFGLSLLRASLLAEDLSEQRRLSRQLEDALARLRAQHVDLTRLGAAVESSEDAIIICSPGGVVLDWNPGAQALYGYSRSEMVGRPAAEVVQVPMAAPGRFEGLIRTKDGAAVEIEATVSSIEDGDGQQIGFVGIFRAVTERKALERELAARAQRLGEAQRLAAVGSFERDLVSGRETWSDELYRLMELAPGTAASYDVYLRRLHPDDRARVEQLTAAHARRTPLEYEARLVRPTGEIRWVAVRVETHSDADGAPVRAAGTVHDITDRKTAQAELERVASSDSLTGLANRDRFTALLQTALDGTGAERATGLLLLDLDGFKDVNDGIGHHAGDLVLQEVARRVRAALGGGDNVARLGGDEFGVVLPGISDVGQAIAGAATVLSCLEAPFDLEGIIVHVGGSVGIAVATEQMTSGALLKQADVAMYRAKTLSSGWAVFEPDQDDLAAGRLQMAVDLRAAIEGGQLQVAYQPLLDTRTRRTSSFEALARWHHPEKGTVPPDQFIPLAEQADLIVPLTRLVLRRATTACGAWRRAGHDVAVAVNLSVRAIRTDDPHEMVAEVLSEAGLAPEHLVLEITESSLATEGDEVRRVLEALRELGVRLVIDDFGTGYSAMSYLKQLPVEEIKIDRSFVREVTTDSRDIAIVRSLVRLAHSLSLRVVAEGVESLDALQALTELGCDYVQGYGIARPMPEDDVLPWLAGFHPPAAARAAGETPSELLIVDDDRVIRTWLSALAEQAGWNVRVAVSAEDALDEVGRAIPDVVILDHHMTGMTGTEAVPHLRARGVDGPILLFTGFLSDAVPSLRVPLDVWPISKSNGQGVLDLLQGYRASNGGRSDARHPAQAR